jgi:hypothetical protein
MLLTPDGETVGTICNSSASDSVVTSRTESRVLPSLRNGSQALAELPIARKIAQGGARELRKFLRNGCRRRFLKPPGLSKN